MTLVVDASVALKWYLIEDGADPARQILADGNTLVASELVVADGCNAGWLAGRRGEVSAAQQGAIAADITRVFDRLEGLVPHASRAAAIARELDHPSTIASTWHSARRSMRPSSPRTAACSPRVAGTPLAAGTRGLPGYTPRN